MVPLEFALPAPDEECPALTPSYTTMTSLPNIQDSAGANVWLIGNNLVSKRERTGIDADI
jgi:hypothetical protein